MDKQLGLACNSNNPYSQIPPPLVSTDQLSEAGSLSETATYHHRCVQHADPFLRCGSLASELADTLKQLITAQERQLALEYTINTVNERLVEPKLRIAFASPPPPLEDWKEQFNQLRHDPEIQKAKRNRTTSILKNDDMSERVLDQLRRPLTGEKFDQLRRQYSHQQGRNPLIKLIDATDVVGEISPKQLVNAIKNAGYSKLVENYSHLFNSFPCSRDSDLTIQPLTPYFTRSDFGRHSWSSRESVYSSSNTRLNRSHSFRGYSTSVETTATSVTNEKYRAISSQQRSRKTPENDPPKSQRSLYDNDAIEQQNAEQPSYPLYVASSANAVAGSFQSSHKNSGYHGRATLSDTQADRTIDYRYEAQSTSTSRDPLTQQRPPLSSPGNMTPSTTPLEAANTDTLSSRSLSGKPYTAPAPTHSTNYISGGVHSQLPQKRPNDLLMSDTYSPTRPILSDMKPLPTELMLPNEQEDEEGIQSQLNRILSQKKNALPTATTPRISTATSGVDSTARDSIYMSTQPTEGRRARVSSTAKPPITSVRSDSLTFSTFKPSPLLHKTLGTESPHRTPRPAGESNKESPSSGASAKQSGSQYWTDSLSQPENSTVKRGDSLPSEFELYRLEDSPPLGMVKKASPQSPGMESKSTTGFSRKSNIGNEDHPTQTRYQSYKEK